MDSCGATRSPKSASRRRPKNPSRPTKSQGSRRAIEENYPWLRICVRAHAAGRALRHLACHQGDESVLTSAAIAVGVLNPGLLFSQAMAQAASYYRVLSLKSFAAAQFPIRSSPGTVNYGGQTDGMRHRTALTFGSSSRAHIQPIILVLRIQ